MAHMYAHQYLKACFVCMGFLLVAVSSYAVGDTTWYSRNWKKTTRENAAYYRPKPALENGLYHTQDYFMSNGQVQMDGYSSAVDTDIRQGYFHYYDSLGNVKSEGGYRDDKEVGKWSYYYPFSAILKEVIYNNANEVRDTMFYKSGIVKRVESKHGDLLDDAYCFDSTGKSIPYFPYEVMPQFPGDIKEYLATHLKYPGKAKRSGEHGRVVVRFIINDKGYVEQARVVEHVSELIDAEAIRVVMNMPRWQPGYQDGVPVRVYFTQPLTFRIED